MIKYLFVIFYLRDVIVFDGGTRQLETTHLSQYERRNKLIALLRYCY